MTTVTGGDTTEAEGLTTVVRVMLPPVPPAPAVTVRRSRRQRIVIALGVACTFLLVLIGVAVGYGIWKFDQIGRVDVSLTKAGRGAPTNILIVGSDSRAGIDPNDPSAGVMLGSEAPGGQRSDTIMIVRTDPDSGSVSVLSLPRDLWVDIAGMKSKSRINTAYSISRQTLIDTIQQDFGIQINHYVEVDFLAFRKLVNVLGGVPLYFDVPVRDGNSGLDVPTPGCRVLDGDQALAFARSRHIEFKDGNVWHNDPTADLGRITRQQIFLRRVLDKASSAGLMNPSKVNGLLDIAQGYVRIDNGLGLDELRYLAKVFSGIKGSDIVSYTVPGENFITSGGAAVLRIDDLAAEPMLNVFRGLPVETVSPSLVKVKVVGAPTGGANAADITKALKALGYTVTATTQPKATTAMPAHTTVRFGAGAQGVAQDLERHLAGGAQVAESSQVSAGTVELTAGADFTTVMATPRDPAVPSPNTTVAPTTTAPKPGATTKPPAPTTTLPPVKPSTSTVGRAIGQAPDGVAC